MRYSAATLSRLRTATVLVFVVGMLAVLGGLFVKFGGHVPGFTGGGYRIRATLAGEQLQNLVANGDVEMAGVPVGKVQGVGRQGGHEVVTILLHHNAPLHQGATLEVRAKTLLNESYVQLTDGSGAQLPSGATLPLTAVHPQTTLNDVLNALDPAVRAKTQALITELQQATAAQGGNLNQILGGLGDIGRNGSTVFDILANQDADLQQMVKQTATLLGVLDEGQGQIAQLVTSAQQVNQTTAAARSSVAGTIQSLPALMQAVRGAAGSVQLLSTTLSPIAANLDQAAPDLNADLQTLPQVTTELRQLNPILTGALQASPPTLGPVQTTAAQVDQLNPSLAYVLSDLDPMVGYLAPYSRDIGSFISNFGAVAGHTSPGFPNYTVAEPELNANSSESPNLVTTQPGGLMADANPAPGQINGSSSSPSGPQPYTPVQRLKY